MAFVGLGIGRDCVYELCKAIDECKHDWGDDPAFHDVAHKLEEVERALDVICASPGHRAALRSAGPVSSGQKLRTDGSLTGK